MFVSVKKPNPKNLKNKSISMTPKEYQVFKNNMPNCKIEIYDENDDCIAMIQDKDLDKLVIDPRYKNGQISFYVLSYANV